MIAEALPVLYCPRCDTWHLGDCMELPIEQPKPLRPKVISEATLARCLVALQRDENRIRAKIEEVEGKGGDTTFFEWELESNRKALEEVRG